MSMEFGPPYESKAHWFMVCGLEEEAEAAADAMADEVLAPPAAQCNWSWSATREPASSSSGVADGRWAARAAGSGSMPTPDHTRPAGLFSPPMAGYRITPVLVFWTLPDPHWVKFTSETDFELPSSCPVLPCYAPSLNRNILDFMK